MTARIIDGKAIAAELRGRVADEVARVQREHGLTPGLAVVLVGNDPASEVYVRSKHKQTQAAGMASFEHVLPADVEQIELLALIAKLNRDPAVHGILVQLPLPKSLDTEKVINAIDPDEGRRWTAPGQCRASGRRICGAVALHAARLHYFDEERTRVAAGPERHRDRSLQSGRPAAAAVAAQRKRHVYFLPPIWSMPRVGKPEMVRGDWTKPGATARPTSASPACLPPMANPAGRRRRLC